ncbi:DUF4190 domain-containing protein [Actinospica robiniae]|uniref:DUF4190 domain-containing protein n=1 Tax=Actinospica robiniae TaxID=304901 RepID=UPI0003FE4396|nr:DUF4190 domain-containing protein [Actinospica robiniae]
MSWYVPLGPEPEDARPWPGPEPEDAIPKPLRAEKASPSTVPGLAYAARRSGASTRTAAAVRLTRINVCSLLSLVLLVLCPPAAIVFGGLGLRQIRRSGERGFGLAVFGIAAGALLTLLLALAVFVLFVLFAFPPQQ